MKMVSVQEVEFDAGVIAPEILALQKSIRYNLMSCELRKKANAYYELISCNFDIPQVDEVWTFIDENPEFYEGIRNKKLL
jgi:hypothetical protein